MAIETRSVELVSDSLGDASVTVEARGVLRAVLSRPDTGAQQPTTLWDLTLTHEGVTLYQDTALSNSVNTLAHPSKQGTGAGADDFQFAVSGNVTLTGANMGSSKRAVVLLYIEQ